MGNLASTIIEAIVGKNDQNSIPTSAPLHSTSQTNNIQPPKSNSTIHTTSAHKNFSNASSTSSRQTFYYGAAASGQQNVSTAKSANSRSSTSSAPLSYANIAKQNSIKNRDNISYKRVSSSTPKTIISKADFNRFQQILYSDVLRQCTVLNWKCKSWNTLLGNKEYQLINLKEGSNEYEDIMDIFFETVSEGIYVSKIVRVENPYLMGQYNLKKLEYKNKGLPVEERELFHGTQEIYVDSICTNNFDWRFHGLTEGNRFGKGVSFTPKSRYANHYCDMYDKVMILAKVLVSSICEGHSKMTIPDYYDDYDYVRYDTSIKEPSGDVLVKYSDDEFYPAYLIYFSGEIYYHRPYPKQGFYR